jgi:diguanylate cyclase (GGDEF)-like protein/PAS domain S-box-containing protein
VTGPRREVAINRVCLAALLAGCFTLAGAWVSDPGLHPVKLAVFFLVLLAIQLRPRRLLHHGEHALGIQLDELLFVPMAVLLAPPETVLLFALTIGIAQVTQRKGWAKTAFNVGQVMLASGAGLALTSALEGLAGHDLVASVFAAAAGGVVFALVSAAAVAGILSFVQRCPFRSTLIEASGPRLLAVFGSVSLGAIAAVAIQTRPVVLLLTLAPALLIQSAFSRAMEQSQERQQGDALYAAANELRASLDVSTVRVRLVAIAQALLGAGSARLVARNGPNRAEGLRHEPERLRVEVDDDWDLEIESRLGGGTWQRSDELALRSLASIGRGAIRNAELFGQIQAITHSQGEGVVAIDGHGRISFINKSGERLLRCSSGVIGRLVTDVFSLEVPGYESNDLMVRLLAGKVIKEDNAVARRPDGSSTPVGYTSSPLLTGGDTAASGAVVVIRDITERKAFEEQLAYHAFHDPLTGLPNRRLFFDRLDHALARSTNEVGVVHGLLLLDLDRFKLVNDSLGHATGDALLIAVAARLGRLLRPADTLARLGGDEFTILVEDLSDTGALSILASQLIDALQAPFILNGRELFVSISIGVAHTGDAIARRDLMSSADAALYRAKADGKGRYALFSGRPAEEALGRLELETSLRRALERDELELHYQPILDVGCGDLYGVEALVRWNPPEGSLLGPDSFVPLAEETGLILPIGAWILATAARQAQAWTAAHLDRPPLTVSVNLSARQFAHPGIVSDVASVLADSGLDPAQLCLEITEGIVMEDTDTTIGRLFQLKALGVKLSIDDFGTGYSSLSYLKRFPVDTVKIDQSFVSELATSAVDLEIVTAVVRLGKAIGITTVAEGVETKGQLALLSELGCRLAQGYFLSPPLRHDDFVAYCDARVPSVPAEA